MLTDHFAEFITAPQTVQLVELNDGNRSETKTECRREKRARQEHRASMLVGCSVHGLVRAMTGDHGGNSLQ